VVRDSSRNPQPRSFGVLPEARRWHVTDHQTQKEVILAGMGWGKLHRHQIEAEVQNGTLVPLAIRSYPTTLEVDIRIARIREKQVGPVAAALWEEFVGLAAATC